jgi:hypothetical protein
VWRASDKIVQRETLKGVKLFGQRLDEKGKPVFDKNGLPINDPLLHVPEFCLYHAEEVSAQRNVLEKHGKIEESAHA